MPDQFGAWRDDVEVASVPARTIIESDRYRLLDRRQSYYDGTCHDWKMFDFDGRVISQGPLGTTPLLSSDPMPTYVPLRQRRPSSPYRLARAITNAFTNLVFGEGRFPAITIAGDEMGQDFARALARVGALPEKMVRLRTIGGSVGTAGLSWSFHRGKPRFGVHNGKHLFVTRWADRDELVPEYATEIYRYPTTRWDPDKRGYVKDWHWYRRDWTPEADVIYLPVLYRPGVDPIFVVDRAKSSVHDDGACHLEWVQNVPTEDIDGEPDYEGLYDSLDTIDLLYSVITRGATLNLDPTLVLKMDLDFVQRMGVKKGSDNALTVGVGGDAQYLELAGTGIEGGLKLLGEERRTALEAAQCVIPDPNEVASQGISSVSINALYKPMLARAGVFRSQYGRAITRTLASMQRAARKLGVGKPRPVAQVPGDLEAPGEEIPYLALPPKIVEEPVLDPATGEPTGEVAKARVDLVPGESDDVDAAWPPYFPVTVKDMTDAATAMSTATGGKAVVSHRTGVEVFASLAGLDPAEEWRRVEEQGQRAAEADRTMSGGLGDDYGAGGRVPPPASEEDDDGAGDDEEGPEPAEPRGA